MKVNILHSQMMKPQLTKEMLIFTINNQSNSQALIKRNLFFKVLIKNQMVHVTISLCKSIIQKIHFYKEAKEINNKKIKKFKNNLMMYYLLKSKV